MRGSSGYCPEDRIEELLSSTIPPSDASDVERELHIFLHACREVEQAADHGDTAHLVERSLNNSTRQDLSWRGDVIDTARFLRDRLRASAVLRLAAASLLLHIAALPVVALYVLIDEPEVPRFSVEVGVRPAPFEAVDSPEPEAELEINEPRLVDELLTQNSLRWSRYQLDASRARFGKSISVVPEWLKPRISALHLATPQSREQGALSSEELWLLAELRMDVFLSDGGSKAWGDEWAPLLDELSQSLDLEDQAGAWLVASSLARAESYGLGSAASDAALRLARERLPRADARRALIEVQGDLRAVLPIDPLWLEAVRARHPDTVPAALLAEFSSISSGGPR